MIRIVSARRLDALHGERDRLRERVRQVSLGADRVLERELGTQRRLIGELEQALKDVSAARCDAEVAATTAEDLRAQLKALQEAASVPLMVHILFHRTVIHSVHATSEAAEAEAARHGAPREGWRPEPGAPLSGSADVEWRIVHQYVRSDGGDPQ